MQRTMVSTSMDAAFFRAFFAVPGVKISPPGASAAPLCPPRMSDAGARRVRRHLARRRRRFQRLRRRPTLRRDQSQVRARCHSPFACTELCGRGGNRYTTNHVQRILAVLYPAEERFTMFFSI
jgi:hypothetical protein